MSDRMTHSFKREAEFLRGLVVQLKGQIAGLKAQTPKRAVQINLPIKRSTANP